MKSISIFLILLLSAPQVNCQNNEKSLTRQFNVVINEIMSDPVPVTGLPDSEYIELHNVSNVDIPLKNWTLTIGVTSFKFPPVEITSGEYLIITAAKDTSKFKAFGRAVGIFNSSVELSNSGELILLQDAQGRPVSWINYSNSWYGDNFKSQGGWSLEQIDPLNPCGGKDNWKASIAKDGGTPGAVNSVDAPNPDLSLPDFFRLAIPADSLLDIYFSEPLGIVPSIERFTINPGNISPGNVTKISDNYDAFRIHLASPLKGSNTYSLIIQKGIPDCTGHIPTEDLIIPFSLPSAPDSADIVINEILFNPGPGGSEFVELYNRTGKTFNMRKMYIGLKSSDTYDVCRLSETDYILNPYTYCLLTKDKELIWNYPVDKKVIHEAGDMASMNDKSGTISLMNEEMKVIDIFSYSEKMHLQILKNFQGISLERINPGRSANDPANWHSAAESSGFGTPGTVNSQYLSFTEPEDLIKLEEEIFSPDNDGYNDVLQVTYKNDKPSCRAQVYIFDCNGQLVRRLLNNELLGTSGFFTWDGMNEGGKRCSTGMYLFFIRFLFPDGTVKDYKKSCILAVRK